MDDGTGSQDAMEEVFKIDEAKIREHVDQVVRKSVEMTLNSLLDAEADTNRKVGQGRASYSPPALDLHLRINHPDHRRA